MTFVPESAIRFAVLSGAHRAASWKCWSPSGKEDVYVSCRETGYAFKASLHASGDWRIQYFDRFYRAAVRDEHRTARGRIIDQWPRPAPIVVGHTLALRIRTPWSSVTTPQKAGSMAAIPAPAHGKAVECVLFLLDGAMSAAGWPGMSGTMRTKLVGSYLRASGAAVCVVWWEIDMPTLPPLRGTPKLYSGRGMDDLRGAEGLRMLGFTDASDGSRVIYDLVVKHAESEARG